MDRASEKLRDDENSGPVERAAQTNEGGFRAYLATAMAVVEPKYAEMFRGFGLQQLTAEVVPKSASSSRAETSTSATTTRAHPSVSGNPPAAYGVRE